MVQDFSRPTLSASDKTYLTNAKKPIAVIREVLQDLSDAGLDVSDDLTTIDNAETARSILLERFGAQRPRRGS